MASTTSGRVLYRSPDALQNLRVKVSLTRVSGPRADRAAELEARLAQERGEAQQQQQVEHFAGGLERDGTRPKHG